jgi:hypothetical protein
MLGDILAQLTDEATASEMILGTGDVTLLAAVQERAAAEGCDLADCVVRTVQRYAAQASDEEWVTLVGMLNRSRDPGTTCLKRAFAHALHDPS